MKALVLERKGELAIRDIDIHEDLGADDVRIAVHTVGICGSDVHYYTHGAIGPFVVKEPMVLGHEASGTVVAVGSDVERLSVGDRVCMEPGIPDPMSRASLEGMYNLDPSVVFWATPPVHGVMREEVVHPAAFIYRLPDSVGYAEAAMVEPLAVGMHAVKKARIAPGDTAVVIGAGTIGIVTALAALAGGCSRVIISDVKQPKLEIAGAYDGIAPVNAANGRVAACVAEATEGWGADVVFEASGNATAAAEAFGFVRPGGVVVLVGIPLEPVPLDVAAAQARETRIETVFRYTNVYGRALALLDSGSIDLSPLVTDTFRFQDAVKAFDYAVRPDPTSVKIQVRIAD
jgi:D-xylulose reductase